MSKVYSASLLMGRDLKSRKVNVINKVKLPAPYDE